MTPVASGLAGYLALNWAAQTEKLADGTYRLTVPQLRDFELFAETEGELTTTWRDALASHLQAYLAVGKVIPTPPPVWGNIESRAPGSSDAVRPQVTLSYA